MYVTATECVRSLQANKFRRQAQERCPSLRNDQVKFPLILSSYGHYAQTTNRALDDWAESCEGEGFYRSLLDTFQNAREPNSCLLAVAVLLCIPTYRNEFLTGGRHLTSADPLMDLLPFTDGQQRPNRRTVLEKTGFSAVRVLMADHSPRQLSEAQQEEYQYLSEILTYALGQNPTTLGCLEGTLDHYWLEKVDLLKNHHEALRSSRSALEAATTQKRGKT